MINAPKSAEIVMAKEIHCLTSGRYAVTTDQRSLRSHLTGACASSQQGEYVSNWGGVRTEGERSLTSAIGSQLQLQFQFHLVTRTATATATAPLNIRWWFIFSTFCCLYLHVVNITGIYIVYMYIWYICTHGTCDRASVKTSIWLFSLNTLKGITLKRC